MSTELLVVPYIVGREATGMGAGPLALRADAERVLAPAAVHRIALQAPAANDVAACFDLNRQVAVAVRDATARGALPVVLTGNCHTQQAVVAGVGAEELQLVWLDCHADFHTPDTTPTGFFDGFGLAMVTGDCWVSLCLSVPGFVPLPEERVVLAGVRDAEEAEWDRLAASEVGYVAPGAIDRLGAFLRERSGGTGRLSLHVDLDVLDPSAGRANAYAAAPGIDAEQLVTAVRDVAAALPLAAVTLSAYDPAYDTDGRVADTAIEILELFA